LIKSFALEIDSISSEITKGKESILSTLWPLDSTISFEAVAAIAEQSARVFSFLLSFL